MPSLPPFLRLLRAHAQVSGGSDLARVPTELIQVTLFGRLVPRYTQSIEVERARQGQVVLLRRRALGRKDLPSEQQRRIEERPTCSGGGAVFTVYSAVPLSPQLLRETGC